jgi:hypothetical protein
MLKRKYGWFFGSLLAISGLIGGTVLIAQAAGPLTVSCSGSVASTTIRWTATSTGGVMPYGYLWSGTNINGSTTNPLYVVYTAGTYTALVTVTDASSTPTSASSTCQATVKPPSTQPLPAFFKSPQLIINPGGQFVARGMRVVSIGSQSFTASVWGTTWTIVTSPTNQFLFRGGKGLGGPFDLNQIRVGDEVSVTGTVDSNQTLTVKARLVRDYSLLSKREYKNENDENDDRDKKDKSASTTSNRENLRKELGDRIKEIQDQISNLKKNFQRVDSGREDD